MMAASQQRGIMIDNRLAANSNNFLVLDQENNQLQFTKDGPVVNLHGHLNLADVVSKLQARGMIKKSAEFYSPDGTRFAKSSKLNEVLRSPFFKLKLDRVREYHVHNSHAFKQSMSNISASERDFVQKTMDSYNINELKARNSSKIFNYIIERLEQKDANTIYTDEDVSYMLRDAMA